jgi:hypothetical protein
MDRLPGTVMRFLRGRLCINPTITMIVAGLARVRSPTGGQFDEAIE